MGRFEMNGLRLTERDKLVFKEFFDHGFLTAKQLTRLEYFPNEKKCRDRLRLLYREGFLDFCQKPEFGHGRPEHVYCLHKRKVKQIAQLLECTTEEVCVAKPGYSPFLLHHLAIVDFCICARNACQKSGEYEAQIIPEYKRWEGRPNNLKKATSQNIVFKGSNFEVIPDAVMCLTRKDKLKSLMFVEIYRGTQTLEGDKHSIQQKLEAYVANLEQKSYERLAKDLAYPFKGFRVLMVVHSVSALEKLKTLCQKMAHGLFWLTLVNNITPDTFFNAIWHVSGDEELKALVKGSE